MKKHDKLCEDAKSAIDKVNGDTSVNPGSTLASLRDIRDHVNMLMTAIADNDDPDADD